MLDWFMFLQEVAKLLVNILKALAAVIYSFLETSPEIG